MNGNKVWNDKNKIKHYVLTSQTRSDVIRKLGFNPKGSVTRRKLNNSIKRFNIDTSHFITQQSKCRWGNINHIKQIINESKCYTEVLIKMGLKPRSGNFTTLKSYVTKHNLNVSHFDHIEYIKNKKYGTKFECVPLTEILEGKHPTYKTYNLKQRLFREGFKEKQCEECGITKWNNKPITFDLEHINGISNDHRWENLKIMCPNCHSQTSTYKGKNRGTLA